jgi:hypothetical protein
MNKAVKHGLIVGGIVLLLGILGFMIFMNSFEIFEEPKKEIVRTECDYEGLRQATVFKFVGNTTANPSLDVSANLGCDGYNDEVTDSILFTADASSLHGDEVEIKWTSFDTLRIIYSADLRVFKETGKMTFEDSTLNFVIEYQKKK